LLIDEASLGLSPLLAETVFKIVAEISRDGTTVVIVEQNIGVLPYADQAVLLQKGAVTYDGSADELMKTNDLRATYLG
jgi:branched-chain amino acid transport system ATP-binding protein